MYENYCSKGAGAFQVATGNPPRVVSFTDRRGYLLFIPEINPGKAR
jgi:hypothetical protein